MKAWKHFKTITKHKRLVRQGCFKVGLYWQGLMHDLSKYSPTEFFVGAKYYQGTRSPNNAEREERGFSSAWLHHQGRNKHHYEYWIDYSVHSSPCGMLPAPMPDKYIVEMLMDRIAACKTYQGKDYTDQSPLNYYLRGNVKNSNGKQANTEAGGKNFPYLHEKTKTMLELLLNMLAEKGEEETFRYIRREILHNEK